LQYRKEFFPSAHELIFVSQNNDYSFKASLMSMLLEQKFYISCKPRKVWHSLALLIKESMPFACPVKQESITSACSVKQGGMTLALLSNERLSFACPVNQ
jgi:hypothetical protein